MNSRSLRFENLVLGGAASIVPISSQDEPLARRLGSRLKAERPGLSIELCNGSPSDHTFRFVVANDVYNLRQLDSTPNTYFVCPGDNFHLQIWSAPPKHLDENFWGCRLGLETVNSCNASCPMCPVKNLTRHRQVMSMNVTRTALAAAAKHPEIQTINFYMNGEPLLDRRLEERISIAKKLGLPYLRISTNGQMLTPERFSSLALAGLDEITVSIDSPVAAHHERIRPGTDFHRIIGHLRQIISMKSGPRPSLMLGMIAGNDNMHLIPKMCALAADIFSADVPVSDAPGYVFRDDAQGIGMFVSRRFDWVGRHADRAADEIRSGPCPGYRDLVVYPDGRMPLCCLDSDGSSIVGDLRFADFDDVVLGIKRLGMINALKNGRADSLADCCRDCSLLYQERPG